MICDWCASDGSLGRLQQGESDDREEEEEDAASPSRMGTAWHGTWTAWRSLIPLAHN